MTSLAASGVRLAALILAALVAGGAGAAVPTVVWDGDFDTTTKTGADGVEYTFTVNPLGNSGENLNTLSGGNLVIGSGSTYGGQISWNYNSSETYTSVLIKYSNFTATDNKVLASVSAETTTGGNAGQVVDDCVSVLSAANSKLAGRFNNNNSVWPNGTTGVATSYASGYMLIVYGSGQDFQFYTSSDGLTWSGGTVTGLKFGTTYACGVGLGGMSGLGKDASGNANNGFGVSSGMTIQGVAIFRGVALTTNLVRPPSSFDSEYTDSNNKKWKYANATFTWKSSSGTDIGSSTGTSVSLFSLPSDADTSVSFACGGNTTWTGSNFWEGFCLGKGTYSAPGYAFRVTSSHSNKSITAGFSPLTLGGLIIESGSSGVNFSDSSRATILGAASGDDETWFGIYDNAKISRGGFLKFSGNVNIEIAKGKTFTVVASSIVKTVTDANGTSTDGGIFRMHGLGTITVPTLTATGGATLDYSDVQEDADVVRSTTPFIQGNLTVDSSTKYVFPSSLAKNTAYTLCSGTLTAPASVICDITVGTTVKKNIPLTFSGNTVSYGDAVYAATVNGTTVTWDGDEPSSFDDIVVTFSGSGTVTGLSGSGTTINAGSSVTVDVTSFTSPTLLGTGTFRYTSGYPTTIPSAEYYYEYVGGATDAEKVTVSDALTINGKLKTSGYIALTGANTLAAGGSLEVLSDKTELAAVQGVQANNWSGGLGGTITVDANAELASLTTDALTRGGSLVNINVYGTLNLGTTRWTMQSSLYHRLNLHGNAEVKGSGDGYGILDFETANSSFVNINVYDGTPTISGPLRFRAKTITWIAANAKLAVTGGTIENSEFAKSGAGTLSFSAVAPSTSGGLSASAGTIELDNISYTAGTITLSSAQNSPTLKMIATDAATTVSAAVNVPANTRGQLAFEGAGTFALSGPNTSGNIVWLGTNPVPGTLQLNGNVTINNGGVNNNYRFNKLGSGSSTLSLAAWSTCYDKDGNPGLGYTFDTIDADAFTGTIALSNSATDSRAGCTMNFSAVNIIKSSAVYGTPLVKVTKAVGARTDSYSNAINVSATQFNGNAATFIYDDSEAGKEGIYLAAATYDGQNCKTIAEAIAAAEKAGQTYAAVTILDATAECPEEYYIDNATLKKKPASITVGENVYYYTTIQAAVQDALPAPYGSHSNYDYLTIYESNTAVAMMDYTLKLATAPGVTGVTVSLPVSFTTTEYAVSSVSGDTYTTYSVSVNPKTYRWKNAAAGTLWTTASNWEFQDNETWTSAQRYPGDGTTGDSVVVTDDTSIQLGNAVTLALLQVTGGTLTLAIPSQSTATTLTASAITLGANGTISLTGVTLSPEPTTNVSHSRVKTVTVDGTTTYSVELIPGTTFTVY